MKVLIQHDFTHCYFQSQDRWTPLSNEGIDFGTFEGAVTFAQENQMTNVQVALIFKDIGQTLFLPVQPE